jgi:hypothetical protein
MKHDAICRAVLGSIPGMLFVLSVQLAAAEPITWTFEDVTLRSNAQLFGSFVYDSFTGAILEWDIVIYGNSSGLADTTYTVDNSTAESFNESKEFYFTNLRLDEALNVVTPALTDSWGIVLITFGEDLIFLPASSRSYDFTSGYLSAAPIVAQPEPKTAVLVLLVGIIAIFLRCLREGTSSRLIRRRSYWFLIKLLIPHRRI